MATSPAVGAALLPAPPAAEHQRLRALLPPRVHLGTSSWTYPGWTGLVWGKDYGETLLSRRGLSAYGQHPLLRCVSLDRSFYRPLDTATYAGMAAQVPTDFRFLVKAPAAVTDASLREPRSGKVLAANPLFLDPTTAVETWLTPAVGGLGSTLGALVFQLSPLPAAWLDNIPALHDRLARLFQACRPALPDGAWLALEVRDPGLLTPDLARLLKQCGVLFCLGLHDNMPPIDRQLPMLRALWPGPLVCRWNLQRGLRYEQARRMFEPFDHLQAPDPQTRETLAKVAAATAAAGHPVWVSISNKAEGCAPLSVVALAEAIVARNAAG